MNESLLLKSRVETELGNLVGNIKFKYYATRQNIIIQIEVDDYKVYKHVSVSSLHYGNRDYGRWQFVGHYPNCPDLTIRAINRQLNL